ncbi:hypothetical protein ACEWY4_001539 [Coilia grayii]|uniref:Reverse transcriptase domain-containing protein n=1 Tax=Coilia grayii TaxID=363190 RepID=A0ABD1KT84_9TELE
MKPAPAGAGGCPEPGASVATPTRPLTHTLPRRRLSGKPPKPLRFWAPYRSLKCGDCQEVLGSLGVAQWHVHTKHPGRAFVGRAGLRAGPAVSRSRWTSNELEVLRRMVEQSGSSPQVLRTALARFPGKTERQIRGRIRATRIQLGSCGNVATGGADNGCFASLFDPSEVLDQLLSIKKGSAAGSDGISVKDLKEWDPEGVKLCSLFNGWWVAGYIPECVKPARTVLLPKTTEVQALNEPGNWRPITIGSFLLRLFSKLLHSRLRAACPISERQRGFVSAPGCSENLFSLLTLVRKAHQERRTLAVVFLDVAKAFDTVCHQHIFDALRQRGVDRHIIKCIRSGYECCTTRIALKGEHSEPIATTRGFRQGEPLSPLLFNLAMDPLLCTLSTEGKGVSVGGSNVAALAFADDLVLLSDSWGSMSHNLEITAAFCKLTGIRIQPNKSHRFLLSPDPANKRNSMRVNRCCRWMVAGESIPIGVRDG